MCPWAHILTSILHIIPIFREGVSLFPIHMFQTLSEILPPLVILSVLREPPLACPLATTSCLMPERAYSGSSRALFFSGWEGGRER